jgi:hypothetical protein
VSSATVKFGWPLARPAAAAGGSTSSILKKDKDGDEEARMETTTTTRDERMNEMYDLHIVQELYYSSQIFYGARVRARFHPKNSATGEGWRALGHIGNIQNKLLKARKRARTRDCSETFGTIFKICRTWYNAVLRMASAWTN